MPDDKKITTPQDATEDFEEIINDKSGLTGITTNKPQNGELDNKDKAHTNTNSGFRNRRNEEIGFASDSPYSNGNINEKNPQDTTIDESMNDEVLENAPSPSETGEQSLSGDMPNPEADDDVLQNAKDMGIALDEDSQNPKELDIGGDLDKAEEYQKTH